MEIKHRIPKIGYQPHSIEFTFESEDEATAFYCIFNHSVICDFLREEVKEIDIITIRNTIGTYDYKGAFHRLNEAILKWSKRND